MSALPRAVRMMFRQRTSTTLTNMTTNLIVDGVTMGLGRPVPTRAKLGVESDQHQRAHSLSCVAMMA
jgi:hypothetical protein